MTHWDFSTLQAESLSSTADLLPLLTLNLSAEDLTDCSQERQGKERYTLQLSWAHTSSAPGGYLFHP